MVVNSERENEARVGSGPCFSAVGLCSLMGKALRRSYSKVFFSEAAEGAEAGEGPLYPALAFQQESYQREGG